MPRPKKSKITSVLLITDTERVQRVFQDLENEGGVQLRTAATLTQGDLDLAESAPDIIFAQSRISGFSSDLALGRLKKSLTAETRIVLLAVDEADAAQARKQGKQFIDLSSEEQDLAKGVRDLLAHPETFEATKGAKPKGAAAKAKAQKAPAKRKAPPSTVVAPITGGGGTEEEGEAASQPLPPPEAQRPEVTAAKGEGAPAPAPAAGAAPGKAPKDKGAPRARRQRKEEAVIAPPEASETAATAVSVEAEKAEKVEEPPVPQVATESVAIVPLPQWIAEGIPADLPMREDAKPGPQEPAAETAVEEKAFPSFAEMMQRAEVKIAPAAEEPSPEASPEPADVMDFRAPMEHRGQEEAEPLSNGMVRATKKRQQWGLPVAVILAAVIIIPIALYMAGEFSEKKPARQAFHEVKQAPAPAPAAPARAPAAAPSRAPASVAEPAGPTAQKVTPAPAPVPGRAPAPAPAPAPARGQAVPVQPPARVQARPPAQAPSPVRAVPRPVPTATRPPAAQPARPAPVAPAQAAKPAPERGLKALPPFLAGARLDPAYGRHHHGWQRFIGARAEYKVYREGDLFRAMQVLALKGQSIPEEVYRKALLEFGGIDSYRIQSSDRKGNYVIERGVAKGGISLTVYRKNTDLSMKGLVIYYP